jgi:hypothetical protein
MELFQRIQHGMEGGCNYQMEKNQSGKYLIMPCALLRTHGTVVVMLQAGRSQVQDPMRRIYSIYLILLAEFT